MTIETVSIDIGKAIGSDTADASASGKEAKEAKEETEEKGEKEEKEETEGTEGTEIVSGSHEEAEATKTMARAGDATMMTVAATSVKTLVGVVRTVTCLGVVVLVLVEGVVAALRGTVVLVPAHLNVVPRPHQASYRSPNAGGRLVGGMYTRPAMSSIALCKQSKQVSGRLHWSRGALLLGRFFGQKSGSI